MRQPLAVSVSPQPVRAVARGQPKRELDARRVRAAVFFGEFPRHEDARDQDVLDGAVVVAARALLKEIARTPRLDLQELRTGADYLPKPRRAAPSCWRTTTSRASRRQREAVSMRAAGSDKVRLPGSGPRTSRTTTRRLRRPAAGSALARSDPGVWVSRGRVCWSCGREPRREAGARWEGEARASAVRRAIFLSLTSCKGSVAKVVVHSTPSMLQDMLRNCRRDTVFWFLPDEDPPRFSRLRLRLRGAGVRRRDPTFGARVGRLRCKNQPARAGGAARGARGRGRPGIIPQSRALKQSGPSSMMRGRRLLPRITSAARPGARRRELARHVAARSGRWEGGDRKRSRRKPRPCRHKFRPLTFFLVLSCFHSLFVFHLLSLSFPPYSFPLFFYSPLRLSSVFHFSPPLSRLFPVPLSPSLPFLLLLLSSFLFLFLTPILTFPAFPVRLSSQFTYFMSYKYTFLFHFRLPLLSLDTWSRSRDGME